MIPSILNNFIELSSSPLGILQITSLVIIILCTLAIILSIIINFSEANRRRVKQNKNSIVETGTMFLFFMIFYLTIRLNFGSFVINNLVLRIFLILTGLFIIVFGTFVNILGRINLGKNWANQVKIYENQTLVTSGVFRLVRHPLYASLIWIFYGASLVYVNYLAFLLNTFIFIPFIYYRAKQEEKLLIQEFKNYREYIQKVGMFFPKIK
jgi:protein-S-isoprenylcysteine O-methyltransferase Ste14